VFVCLCGVWCVVGVVLWGVWGLVGSLRPVSRPRRIAGLGVTEASDQRLWGHRQIKLG